jgi:hypothetical protein
VVCDRLNEIAAEQEDLRKEIDSRPKGEAERERLIDRLFELHAEAIRLTSP